MNCQHNTIGLFVTNSEISELAVNKCRERNISVLTFSFFPAKTPLENFHLIKPGNLQELLHLFVKHEIKEIVLVGKIEPSMLFQSNLHESGKGFLENNEQWGSEILLKKIAGMLSQYGIEILPLTDFFCDELVCEKVYTQKKPSESCLRDINTGLQIGQILTKYQVGQSVTVKNGMILAVEGIEGTDKMIERTGKYCDGFVTVKVAGKNKDVRFDLPVIGTTTIESIHNAGGKLLAVESGKTILTNEKACIELCDKYGICFLGTPGASGKMSSPFVGVSP